MRLLGAIGGLIKHITMYVYNPEGMVIFETTGIKLKRKDVAATVCRGNLTWRSRVLTMPSLGS